MGHSEEMQRKLTAVAGGKMKDDLVLIVDDDPIYRTLLKRMLGKIGYDNIMEAENGNEALQMALEHSPVLILMDIQMPSRNGIDATREIRTCCPNAKIIMMTGKGTPTLVTDSMSAGASNFLLKPFEMVQFNAVVRRALGAQ